MSKIIKEVGFKRIIKYFIFSLWQWLFDLLPFSPCRIFWLRLGGVSIGKNCVVDKVDFINLDRTGLTGLTIGKECFLGRGALFDLAGKITLEDQVTVSPKAAILSHFSVGFANHPLVKKYPKFVKKTVVRQGVFIGLGATVMPGLVIGEKTMIAAGSVVRENTPADCLVAGVPAKLKKK